MKLMMLVILLAGAFLGGYYLGHQPGSPDVFGYISQGRQAICGGVERVADADAEAPVAESRGEWDPAFAGVKH